MGRRDAEFATATRQNGDSLVLSPTGELDMATAPEFEEASERAQGGSAILIDLRGLTFIDSEGIKALVRVYAAGRMVVRASRSSAARTTCNGFFRSPESNRFSHGRTYRQSQPTRPSPGSLAGRTCQRRSGASLRG
jgi:anti-anti-sigma factor